MKWNERFQKTIIQADGARGTGRRKGWGFFYLVFFLFCDKNKQLKDQAFAVTSW